MATSSTLRRLMRESDDLHRHELATIDDTRDAIAARAAQPLTRRHLMQALASGLAVGMGAQFVGPFAGVASAQADDEPLSAEVLAAFAASIELAAVEVYKAAAASGKVTTPAVLDAAALFISHHTDHAQAFARLGQVASPVANPKLLSAAAGQLQSASDEADVLKIAYELEWSAAATYITVIGADISIDAVGLAASIAPVEASHAQVLAEALGLIADIRVGGSSAGISGLSPSFVRVEEAISPTAFPIE